tara:strand:- start:2290 stop:2745 length:456 start_codon:yes stop_codon:yes gene_type:complete
MSTIKVDTITDGAGTGAPTFSQGATVTGTLAATTLTGTLASSNLTGALPAIDGSALTGVGASTTYGAVGTYVAGYVNAGLGVAVDNNDTTAGSNILMYDSAIGLQGNNFSNGNQGSSSTTSAGLTGTWRCMAGFKNNSATYFWGSLWVRIS